MEQMLDNYTYAWPITFQKGQNGRNMTLHGSLTYCVWVCVCLLFKYPPQYTHIIQFQTEYIMSNFMREKMFELGIFLIQLDNAIWDIIWSYILHVEM